MTAATHNEIVRLFPGLQDHTVVEILATGANIEDLEAALAILASNDDDLIDVQQREGGQIHRLLAILNQSEILPQQERDI